MMQKGVRKGKIFCPAAAVSAFALALVLCGCHGSKGMKAFVVPKEFDEGRKYAITFWAKNDTNKAQTDIYGKAIKDFEKIYPEIHVNMKIYSNYGDIYNDVITNISTNTTPNVCITYPDHIATYLTGVNTVAPLDDLFDDGKYGLGGKEVRFDGVRKEEISPEFLKECLLKGKHYAIPFMRSTEACYVNKTFVEKLGYTLPKILTWDFIFEVSEAAMEKDADGNFKVNGQNVLIPFIYKSTDNMMIQMLRQKGAGYSDEKGDILLFNDTTKELLFTLAKYGKSKAFSTFKISGYPANFMNAGQCIFAVDSTAGSTWMGTDAPLLDISKDKLIEFETEVYPVPQFDASNPTMISQGPSVCVFNKSDPQEVLASWLFAQYLLTDQVQISYAETEGYIPVTTSARNLPQYQDYLSRGGSDNQKHYEVKVKATKLLLDNIPRTFVTPVFNGSASLRDAAGQLIEDTVKCVRRKQNVDEGYIGELFHKVESLYRLGEANLVVSGKKNLGPLPFTSVILLSSLALAWLCLIAYFLYEVKKKKKR